MASMSETKKKRIFKNVKKPLPTILYFFRSPVEKQLLKVEQGKVPKDYFYFLYEVKKSFTVDIQGLVYLHKFVYWLHLLMDKLMRLILGFDFPIIPLIGLKLKSADIVFATTPKLGLMLSLFKKLRKFHGILVINIVGLYDQLKQNRNLLTKLAVKQLLSHVDGYVAGSSWHECQKLAAYLDLPLSRFAFAPYSGIDTHFFSPAKIKEQNYILGIGTDPSRDWDLYKNVAKELPQEDFFIATDLHLFPQPVPRNMHVEFLDPEKLRDAIRYAKLILILTTQNHHFSGQASTFRAMSCSKTVILTQTFGYREFKLKHLTNCVLIPPGDIRPVIQQITRLNQNPQLRKRIGQNAARLINKHYNHKLIGQKYTRIFKYFFQKTYT